MTLRFEAFRGRLELKIPFVISGERMEHVMNVFVRLTDDEGRVGWGEHAPSPRVTGESLEDVERECRELAKNPDWVDRLLEDAQNLPGGVPRPGARNALTAAWVDLEGRARGEPGWELLNLPRGGLPTSMTVGIMEPERAVKVAQQYVDSGYDVLKVKLGGPQDEETMEALRSSLPEVRIRVDANEGWTLAQAQRRLPLLERLGVEFVEQPLRRSDLKGLARLTRESPLPVFLDESVLNTADLIEAVHADAGHGIVIKLAKCGGVFEARRLVKMAKSHGLETMLGCMVESAYGISAAAQLVGAVDHADLDGNQLVTDDFDGHRLQRNGTVTSSDASGLGVGPLDASRLEPL